VRTVRVRFNNVERFRAGSWRVKRKHQSEEEIFQEIVKLQLRKPVAGTSFTLAGETIRRSEVNLFDFIIRHN